MTMNARIAGTGAYLPTKIVTNHDLEKQVETNDAWIKQRTGISQRHVAADDQATSDLAFEAAKQALESAGLNASDIGGIIVATTTPDYTFPSVAVEVQAKLGMISGFAFDVQAVCSGFVYAVSVANAMIATGQAKHMLVIGAEKMSSVVDWTDRRTAILFGDGAGAVVLSACDDKTQGVLATKLYSDGRYRHLLQTTGGVSTTGEAGTIVMEGQEVFKHAVADMKQAVEEILADTDTAPSDVDWLVPHQANLRIIKSLGDHLKMPIDKVIVTVDKHANTSAASIPLALHEGIADGRIKRGQLLLMESMGGGFTWGSALIRY